MLGEERGREAKENERAQKGRHWGGSARLNAPRNARGASRAKSATQLTSRIDKIGSNVD